MTDEVKKYAEKCILESNIRMVPGHYPDFKSKEHVDKWLKMSQAAFEMYKTEELEPDEMTEVELEHYRVLLQRLKKNKDNVPKDVLLTKYEKSYNRLRNEIADMTSQILKDIVLYDLKVKYEEAVDVYVMINRTITESGILQEVSHAVYQNQDADRVIECAVRLRELIHQRVEEGNHENSDSTWDADQR